MQVYPIGIGLEGLETPVMETRVGQKIPNPTWTPTAGIRKRSLERGITLPAVVLPGRITRLDALRCVWRMETVNTLSMAPASRTASGCASAPAVFV